MIPCLSHSLNSATAAKSPARESGGTWSFFSNLEEPDIMSAILVFSDKKKKKKEAAALFNRRQRCMNCDSEWMQGWPGFALNMRAIRDSCQPPATFGRKSETEWVQEPRASAGTRPAVRRHLLLQVLLQHRPLNEPSLWFQPCPVLAHFHYKTKRQCQGNREQNGFVLLPA